METWKERANKKNGAKQNREEDHGGEKQGDVESQGRKIKKDGRGKKSFGRKGPSWPKIGPH